MKNDQKKIGKVMREFKKGGFALVLDRGSEQTVKIVIYNKDTIDLTEQVIKEFDRTNSK